MPRGSSSATLAQISEKKLPSKHSLEIASPIKSKLSKKASEVTLDRKVSRKSRAITLQDVNNERFPTDDSNSLCGVDNEEVIETVAKITHKESSGKVLRIDKGKRKGKILKTIKVGSQSRKRQSIFARYLTTMTGIGRVPVVVIKEQSLQAIRILNLQQWHLSKLRRRFDDIDVDHSGSIDQTEFMVSMSSRGDGFFSFDRKALAHLTTFLIYNRDSERIEKNSVGEQKTPFTDRLFNLIGEITH